MRKGSGASILVVLAPVFPFVLTPVPLYLQEKVANLRYSNFFSTVHPISKLAGAWCKELDEGASTGRPYLE